MCIRRVYPEVYRGRCIRCVSSMYLQCIECVSHQAYRLHVSEAYRHMYRQCIKVAYRYSVSQTYRSTYRGCIRKTYHRTRIAHVSHYVSHAYQAYVSSELADATRYTYRHVSACIVKCITTRYRISVSSDTIFVSGVYQKRIGDQAYRTCISENHDTCPIHA